MTATDRSACQQAADHTGREARIEAVTRDLVADVVESGESTEQIGRQS